MTDLLTVKVASKVMEADSTASFELVDPAGSDLPSFTAGSHVDVHLSDNIIRQFSLCNNPRENHRYWLGVLREVDGRGGSAAMHDNVNAGDTIQISTPRNNFNLLDDKPKSLLLAGGIGVTPILSMVQRLHDVGSNFSMHYCTRNRARMAFHDFIRNAPFVASVDFHFDDGDKAQLLDIPGVLASQPEGTNVYVCGPKPFMDIVISTAEQSYPGDAIHREYFTAEPIDHSADGSFEVKLASSGDVYTIPADKSIVDALAEHGIEIPVSCEQGICGTCLTGVIEGEPEHHDSFLTDDEHTANKEMTLCCSRSKTPRLVLDL